MISSETSLWQLADIDEQAVMYIRRFGLITDASTKVKEINERLGYQEGFVSRLLNDFCSISAIDYRDITKNYLPDLVQYLRDSHRFYTQIAFPYINRSLENILLTEDPAVPAAFICQTFIQHYEVKLKKHFADEERYLFPLAEEIIQFGRITESADRTKFEVINDMQSQHHSLNIDLQKIHEVLLHYRISERSFSPLHTVLQYMAVLQRDIRLHEYLEDEILMEAIADNLRVSSN